MRDTGRVAIASAFAKAATEDRVAFCPFLTAGFPTRQDTVPLLLALQEGGADLIELGIPFSDPLADGGTIQQASQTALDQDGGVTIAHSLEFVKQARSQGLTIPVVFMGYVNPFMQYGEEKVTNACLDRAENDQQTDRPTDTHTHTHTHTHIHTLKSCFHQTH